jgi:drug/metabolite transporter (DMT)-like permease
MFISAHLVKAVAWMMGALLSFVAMAISVRELSSGMHAFEMLFIRSAIGVVILGAVIAFRHWRAVHTGRIWGHVGRNIVHFGGQTFWIFGISLLPLSTVSAIEFTTPMWGTAMVVLLLGERMNRGRWIALGLGFVGILVILRPDFGASSGFVSAGALIMLACTFCFGATSAITKWLTRTESALTILFYMVVIQTLLGAVASIFVWTPLAWADTPMLVVLAVTGLTAHYCLNSALAEADATIVMPMEFLRLPLITALAYWLYNEDLDPIILIGAALIFSGNLYSLRYESRAGPASGPARSEDLK